MLSYAIDNEAINGDFWKELVEGDLTGFTQDIRESIFNVALRSKKLDAPTCLKLLERIKTENFSTQTISTLDDTSRPSAIAKFNELLSRSCEYLTDKEWLEICNYTFTLSISDKLSLELMKRAAQYGALQPESHVALLDLALTKQMRPSAFQALLEKIPRSSVPDELIISSVLRLMTMECPEGEFEKMLEDLSGVRPFPEPVREALFKRVFEIQEPNPEKRGAIFKWIYKVGATAPFFAMEIVNQAVGRTPLLSSADLKGILSRAAQDSGIPRAFWGLLANTVITSGKFEDEVEAVVVDVIYDNHLLN